MMSNKYPKILGSMGGMPLVLIDHWALEGGVHPFGDRGQRRMRMVSVGWVEDERDEDLCEHVDLASSHYADGSILGSLRIYKSAIRRVRYLGGDLMKPRGSGLDVGLVRPPFERLDPSLHYFRQTLHYFRQNMDLEFSTDGEDWAIKGERLVLVRWFDHDRGSELSWVTPGSYELDKRFGVRPVNSVGWEINGSNGRVIYLAGRANSLGQVSGVFTVPHELADEVIDVYPSSDADELRWDKDWTQREIAPGDDIGRAFVQFNLYEHERVEGVSVLVGRFRREDFRRGVLNWKDAPVWIPLDHDDVEVSKLDAERVTVRLPMPMARDWALDRPGCPDLYCRESVDASET